MKNYILSIVLLSLAFGLTSCNDDDSILNSSEDLEYTEYDQLENERLINLFNMDFFGTTSPEIIYLNGRSIEEAVDEIISQNQNRFPNIGNPEVNSPTLTGPFYKTGNRVTSFSNKKILFNGEGGYPPPGVYFADIYTYPVEISIPTNVAYAFLDSEAPADNVGYINYTTQERGINTDEVYSGGGVRKLRCNTMSIKITQNTLGQIIPQYRPFNISSVKYKYYFLTL